MCIARGVAKGFLYKIILVFFALQNQGGEKVTEIDVLRGCDFVEWDFGESAPKKWGWYCDFVEKCKSRRCWVLKEY